MPFKLPATQTRTLQEGCVTIHFYSVKVIVLKMWSVKMNGCLCCLPNFCQQMSFTQFSPPQ